MRSKQIIRSFFCSSVSKQQQKIGEQKSVEVKVKFDGEIFKYNFPLFGKLAVNLNKVKVPLQFECGYSCSCGTCPVIIENKQDFERILKDQPMSQSQLTVINQNSFDQQKTRLSCQLFVMQYFKDITFLIQ